MTEINSTETTATQAPDKRWYVIHTYSGYGLGTGRRWQGR